MLAALPVLGKAEVRKSADPCPQVSGTNSLRLGGPVSVSSGDFVPPFGSSVWSGSLAEDPRELAQAHRRLGYRAAYCPHADPNDRERIKSIEEAFRAENVVIAEVQAFGPNMMASDSGERTRALESTCSRLALADEVGARCCVITAGWFGEAPDNRTHPDNLSEVGFDLIVQNVRSILDAVRPKRAKFTLEMMPWIIPDSPDAYVNLIRAVDRPGFGVHFDPTNIINSPRRYFENTALLEECVAKLGRWIVSCHCKDVLLTGSFITHINEVPPGAGVLDHHTLLKGIAGLPQNPPILLEHLQSVEEYRSARQHLFKVGQEIGVSF